MIREFSTVALITLLLSSCVSPERAYEAQQAKNRCVANGGRVVDNVIAPKLMQRCIPSYEWKASDRKIAECRAGGNYYKTDYEGLFQGCYLPTTVVATQPVQAYDPSKNAPACLFCRMQEKSGDAYKPTTSMPSYSAPAPNYPSSQTDYDWDWDYQPANGQWACRGIQTGRYAQHSNCLYDAKDDDRWPG